MRYPVVRSTLLGICLAGAIAMNAGVLLAWALAGAVKSPLHLAIAASVWVLGSVSALHFWFRPSVGALVWSGKSWRLEKASVEHAVSALEVHFDLQSFLWLRLHCHGMRPQWVWLERSAAPEHWLDLRRAVYSRPKPGAPGAPHSAWRSDLQA